MLRQYLTKVLIVAYLTIITLIKAKFQCHNRCSGHGICNDDNYCWCYDGFTGPDCSMRTCPYGLTWADKAHEMNVAHRSSECSGRGKCNRNTGKCSCAAGYTGLACDKLTCVPQNCNGHGRCMTMNEIYKQTTYREKKLRQYTGWEGNHVSMCLCDFGYGGPDCSYRLCPKGDDPNTLHNAFPTIQIKTFARRKVQGYYLFYFHSSSFSFPPTRSAWTATDCKNSFESLPNVGKVSCTLTSVSEEVNTYTVKFLSFPTLPYENNIYSHTGEPPLSAFYCDPSLLSTEAYCSVERVYQDGNIFPEYEYCSNRGVCDFKTGSCRCFRGFENSNCNSYDRTFRDFPPVFKGDILRLELDNITYENSIVHLHNDLPTSNDFFFLNMTNAVSTRFYIDGVGNAIMNYGSIRLDRNFTTNAGKTVEVYRGGMSVRGGMSITNGGLNIRRGDFSLTGAIYVRDSGVAIAGGVLNSSMAGITADGGMTVNGYLTTSTLLVQAGGATVNLGGVVVTGGVSVNAGGLVIQRRGLTIHSGGLAVTGGITLRGNPLLTQINSAAGYTIASGGLRITSGGATVTSDGIHVLAGGASVHGGVYVDSGMNVQSGLFVTPGTITVYDSGVYVENSVTVGGGLSLPFGLEATSGFSVNTGGFRVTGGLTIRGSGLALPTDSMTVAGGVNIGTGLEIAGNMVVNSGLAITAGGLSVTSGSISVRTGGAVLTDLSINDGGLYATTLTVTTLGMAITDGLTVESLGLVITGDSVFDSMTVPSSLTVSSARLTGVTVGTTGVQVTSGGFQLSGDASIVGGMSASDSLRVATLNITSDGLHILDGGLSIDGGLQVNRGGVTLQSGLSITAGGMTINSNIDMDDAQVSDGIHISVSSGTGLQITDSLTIAAGGMTIDTGNVMINSGVTVASNDATAYALNIMNDGMTVANGLIVSDRLSIQSGLRIVQDGASISGPVTVANGLRTTALTTSLGLFVNSASTMYDSGIVINSGTATFTNGLTVNGDAVVTSLSPTNLYANTVTISGTVSAGGVKARFASVVGGMTINTAGLSASSLDSGTRVNVNGGGLRATNDLRIAGGLFITGTASVQGGLSVSGGLTINSGGFQVTGMSIASGNLHITDGVTVSTGGLKVNSGGMTIHGTNFYVGSGLFAVTNGLSITGSVYVAGATYHDGLNQYSDENLKENIVVIDNALDRVEKLRGMTYKMINVEDVHRSEEEIEETLRNSTRSVGVIAQDVKKVLPEAIFPFRGPDNEEYYSVAYSMLIPLLIEAIHELQVDIETELQLHERVYAFLKDSEAKCALNGAFKQEIINTIIKLKELDKWVSTLTQNTMQ